jgi:AcrR family transcriptional regulator
MELLQEKNFLFSMKLPIMETVETFRVSNNYIKEAYFKGFQVKDVIMPIDQEIKARILETAREHFLKLGFSKVTMNEVAEELGMSKKTLYEYFPSKEDLLSEAMTSMQTEITNKIANLVSDDSINFVQKLQMIMNEGAQSHSKFSNQFWIDMQRNAPNVWKCCDDFRIEKLRRSTEMIVHEGVRNGFFRRDLNEEIVVTMYLSAVQNLMKPEVLAHLPVTMQQLFESIIKIIFEGILTEDARANRLARVLEST